MELAATLILFAKYPTPGKVKTRLIPVVGADAAAHLAEALFLDLAEKIARSLGSNIACVLCFDPPEAEAKFSVLLEHVPGARERFACVPQHGADLGKRLANALIDVKKTHAGPYIFIGTDTPELTAGFITAGIGFAEHGKAFFIPAVDGGYVMLTLPSDAPPEVFDTIRWSTSETAGDQALQLRRLGIDVFHEDRFLDIDEPRDVAAVFDRLERDRNVAPRTFQTIARECSACLVI